MCLRLHAHAYVHGIYMCRWVGMQADAGRQAGRHAGRQAGRQVGLPVCLSVYLSVSASLPMCM